MFASSWPSSLACSSLSTCNSYRCMSPPLEGNGDTPIRASASLLSEPASGKDNGVDERTSRSCPKPSVDHAGSLPSIVATSAPWMTACLGSNWHLPSGWPAAASTNALRKAVCTASEDLKARSPLPFSSNWRGGLAPMPPGLPCPPGPKREASFFSNLPTTSFAAMVSSVSPQTREGTGSSMVLSGPGLCKLLVGRNPSSERLDTLRFKRASSLGIIGAPKYATQASRS
mmetsp:Transcript_717/g.1120  ORF Transcript_717/g.1120 Transcript_717/m.1120 type:complete len:229 (-) Transcript_717:1102-1788(-)